MPTFKAKFDSHGRRCPRNERQLARLPECGAYERSYMLRPNRIRLIRTRLILIRRGRRRMLLQAQLSQENLAKAIAAVQANPNVYKG